MGRRSHGPNSQLPRDPAGNRSSRSLSGGDPRDPGSEPSRGPRTTRFNGRGTSDTVVREIRGGPAAPGARSARPLGLPTRPGRSPTGGSSRGRPSRPRGRHPPAGRSGRHGRSFDRAGPARQLDRGAVRTGDLGLSFRQEPRMRENVDLSRFHGRPVRPRRHPLRRRFAVRDHDLSPRGARPARGLGDPSGREQRELDPHEGGDRARRRTPGTPGSAGPGSASGLRGRCGR